MTVFGPIPKGATPTHLIKTSKPFQKTFLADIGSLANTPAI
jgi:hypothetical protein